MDNELKNYIDNTDDSIDLSKIFRLLLMQSKLILAIIITITSLSVIYYLNAEKQYKISSLVQVLPKDANNFTQGISGDFSIGSYGSTYTSNAESIEQLYKSRSNLISVVEKLNLNISIDDLDYEQKLFIERLDYLGERVGNESVFSIKFLDKKYEIYENGNDLIFSGQYGLIEENTFFIAQINEPSVDLKGSKLNLKIKRPENTYRSILSKLEIGSPTRSSYSSIFNNGLILQISFTTRNIEEGISILNAANNQFISDSIRVESEQARKAINFIDLRSYDIEQDLEVKKSTLNNFRETNKTVDVDLEIQSIITSLKDIENKLNSIDIEIEKAKSNYTETNPFFLNLQNQKQTLLNQKEFIESKIENLPLSQQRYIDLYRDLEITQDVFNELSNRKLEFSLKEASTTGNLRVVDAAHYNYIVSPQPSLIIFSLFVSVLISIVFAIFRGFFFLPISNPAEIEDNKISTPILGVINKTDMQDLEDEDSERFKQALESLVVNIETKLKDVVPSNKGKTIVYTSPTAANGKSFVSRNTAKMLADLGNKVLLIDSDYKRGDQHGEFGVKKISVGDFFNINEKSIENFYVGKNLCLIPRLSKVKSSFEFLYDERFKSQIKLFQSKFDYIVIDTAPVLSVSDTLILLSYADLSLCVVRHGLSKINEIKQTHTLFNQIGKNPDGIVYNCFEKPSSYYGYYGVYGNYSYQYYAKRYLYQSYDYNNENNN